MRIFSSLFLLLLSQNILFAQINSEQFNNDLNKTGFLENLENDIYALYCNIIDKLLGLNKNVYLIHYSFGDLDICKRIKNHYIGEDKVVLLEGDYDVIQLNKLLSKMQFIIASRYHSIVHAYKNGVPAIVIGWAQKYPELMEIFNQEMYYFDIRDKIDLKYLSLLKRRNQDFRLLIFSKNKSACCFVIISGGRTLTMSSE